MVGGNREAAEYSGVNVRLVIGAVMVISRGVLGHRRHARRRLFRQRAAERVRQLPARCDRRGGGRRHQPVRRPRRHRQHHRRPVRAGRAQQRPRPRRDRQLPQDPDPRPDPARRARSSTSTPSGCARRAARAPESGRGARWPQPTRRSTARKLASILAGLPDLRARLGGKPAEWRVREVGDGNLNLVFIVEGPAGGLVSSRRCPMCASSANPGRCRSSGPGSNTTRWSSRRASARPDAASLPLRSRAGDDRDGIPFAAYHHAQGYDPRRSSIRASPTTSPSFSPRRCSTPRCSPAPRPSTSAGSNCSRATSSSAGSPRTWSSPIPIARRRSTAGRSPQLDAVKARLRGRRAAEGRGAGAQIPVPDRRRRR